MRRLAAWLWLGIAGNAVVLVIYFASRSIGLPIGPDTKTVEAWGRLDLVCSIEEILLIVIAAAILGRPGLLTRPVRLRSQVRSLASRLAAPGQGSWRHSTGSRRPARAPGAMAPARGGTRCCLPAARKLAIIVISCSERSLRRQRTVSR